MTNCLKVLSENEFAETTEEKKSNLESIKTFLTSAIPDPASVPQQALQIQNQGNEFSHVPKLSFPKFNGKAYIFQVI